MWLTGRWTAIGEWSTPSQPLDPDAAEAADALDARIMAEGLTTAFLRVRAQGLTLAPTFADLKEPR